MINNGGISVRSDILSSPIDIDMKIMQVNYFGTVALTKGICYTGDRLFFALIILLFFECSNFSNYKIPRLLHVFVNHSFYIA